MSEQALVAEPAARAPRTWPARFAPLPAERIELACSACNAPWWIHVDLAGYALRCECGAWLRVPPDPRSPGSMRAALATRIPRALPVRGTALPARDTERRAPRERAPRPEPPRAKPARARASLQLAGLATALLLPACVLFIATGDAQRARFEPLASLFAGLVVLATGLFSNRQVASGLRGAAPRFFAEGLAFAFAAAALTLGWQQVLEGVALAQPWQATLREDVGYGGALFLAALCPAVFEELAFRGLFQGRAATRIGRRAAIFASAAVFALAHGPLPQLPLVLLVGLHLGSLRARSRSLLPCIVEHGLYSGLLVLLA